MVRLICRQRGARQVDSAKAAPLLPSQMSRRSRRFASTVASLAALLAAPTAHGQADPASEPSVLAVAKVLPAVVNINTERVVRRRVRDPFEDFAAQYFGNFRAR